MAQSEILGLDIGSETIRGVVVEPVGDGKVKILHSFSKKSKGIRKGVVVDMEGAVSSINAIFDDIEKVSKGALKNIYFNVGGVDARVHVSRGTTAVSRASSEIHKDDVDRVIENSRAISLPSNRSILHTLHREFIVDGVGDIQDPLGMVGTRLEVISLLIDAFQPTIKNLSKWIDIAGGSVSGIIFSPLSSSKSVLTDNQKELGVVLIDMGAGSTGISVYEENKLLHTKVFRIGAGNITNDLALALRVPVDIAEKIKLHYGYAVSSEVPGKEKVDLSKIDPELKGKPSKKFIAEVIEARIAEICEIVNKELRSLEKERALPGGVVVVGGGAKMPGIADLIQAELRLTTQIGVADPTLFRAGNQGVKELLESPEYTCVLGLPLWSDEVFKKKRVSGNSLVKMVKNLLP